MTRVADPFAIEVLGALAPTLAGYSEALVAWLRCDIESERFDRTLEGYWSPHEPECWIPLDRGASARHARKLVAQTWDELTSAGISAEAVTEAYGAVRDLGFLEQSRILERLQCTENPDEPSTSTPASPKS